MLSCCDVMLPTPNPLLERVAVGALPTNASYSWMSCLAAPSEVWKDATQEAAGSKGFPIRTPLGFFSGFLAQESARLIFCLGCSTWIMIPRTWSFKLIHLQKHESVFENLWLCNGGQERGKYFGKKCYTLVLLFKLPWDPFLMNRNGTEKPCTFWGRRWGGEHVSCRKFYPLIKWSWRSMSRSYGFSYLESDGCRNQVSTVSHYWASFRYQLIGQLYRLFHVGSVCFVVFGWWSRCSLKWCSYSFPSGSQLKQCQGAIKVTVHWQSRQDGYPPGN